jgi:uncharacterized membrane protein (UPF0136 family)
MSYGPIVLLVYGLLMLAGGVMGFRAGSKASLYAGGGSGVVLLAAWALTFRSPALGLWIGMLISLLLCVVTGGRLAATRKIMPAGMLLLASVVAFVLLLLAVRG